MRDLKILIVVPRDKNTKDIDYTVMFPLGLGYISSSLKKVGYNVDCLNLNHHNGATEEILNNILNKKKYGFVCTGNNSLGYNLTKKIISIVKQHKSKPQTILGGTIITTEPELIFSLLKPSFGVIGEGEETIVELLNTLEQKKEVKKVKGIIFFDKTSEKIVLTPPRDPIQDLDSLPWPDFEGIGLERFLDNQYTNSSWAFNPFDYPRAYPILGSRGCPFNCTFCYHYARYRKRSIKNIMEEITTMVKKYKINILLFYDECIAADKERLLEFCKKMKEFRKKLPWDLKWSPQLTVHNIDEKILKIMKEAGVFVASYGFESFSQTVLNSMRKPITPTLIESAFFKTLNAGIGIQANFIFGDVAETKETAKETLDWWKKNAKGQIHLTFIQPFPVSEIYKHCLKKGIIKDKRDFIENKMSSYNFYNMTNNMTDEEMKKLRREILNYISKYRVFVKDFSIKKIKKNKYSFKIKCPFCGKLVIYNNCFLTNKFLYGFYLTCRNCYYRFYVVSYIQKLAYRFYPITRIIRDYQMKRLERPNK